MPAGGAWGTFNPYTYQQQRSTGRGFDPSQWGAGKGGNQPPMPYSGFGAWGQPGGQQSQWSTSGMSPYGRPSGAGYYSGRTPTGRGGGGGMGGFGPGMSRGPGAGGAGSPWGRGGGDYNQSQFERLQRLTQLQDMYGQIYGQDPNFQSAFGRAGMDMLDPRGSGKFRGSAFFNLLGGIDPMSHSLATAPSWSHPQSSPYYQGG